MGYLTHHRKTHHVGLMQGIGQKIKNLIEIGGTIKGIYDTGKAVYAAGQAAAPFIESALPLLGLL